LKYAETRKKKDTRELHGSLHVYRMTAKEAKEASKRVSRTHQKKQRKLSEKTLFLRQFVLVFTSLSPEVLAGEVVLGIYRCRWQIGVSREGFITQLAQVQPRPRDASLVA
jgi:hypothetical protein